MDILFLTAGSYSDYHILGAFVGERKDISKIKVEIKPIFKAVIVAEKAYYNLRRSGAFWDSPEMKMARDDYQQKKDKITYELLEETAKRHNSQYIDQSDENTIWCEEDVLWR